MKITTILQVFLLLLAVFCSNLLAQTYPPGYVPTTPCPTNGYNPNFDWTTNYYDFYLNGSWGVNGYKQMRSPWVNHPNNNNLGSFPFTGEADYSPTYGWVLVKYDFGTPTDQVNHPYLILYNKWRGTLRIFVAISAQQGTNAQKSMFLVKFPNDPNNSTPYKSGIFEFNRAGNGFNALDKFDNQIPTIQKVNQYCFDLPYWVYTDIATAYSTR